MQPNAYEVPLESLRWVVDLAKFKFECTKELVPLREFIGQERAVRAVEFGLSMRHPGYNIYVAGLTGTGKTSVVKAYIEKVIQEKEKKEGPYYADDWCYLYNFDDGDQPQIVRLPRGKGKVFKGQISDLLRDLKAELGKAFSSEEYSNQKKRVVEEGQAEQRKLFEKLNREAAQQGFLFQPTQLGPALIPMSSGKPMEQSEYLALDEAAKEKIEKRRAELMKRLAASFEKAYELEKKTAERLQENDRKIGELTISRLFEGLLGEYRPFTSAAQYLTRLKSYTLDHLDMFKEQEPGPPASFGIDPSRFLAGREPFLPFQVNVFVDNSETKGPPVIEETNPIFGNMFGKIERRFFFGGYLSDHMMLKPGALSRANGGYLLLNARDVLVNPGVWPALKRALKNKEVRIEDPFEQFGLIAPQGLRPQPMPVDVKVILTSDAMLYQLLAAYDEDFWEIFRIKADFDFQIEKTEENIDAYASFICNCCEETGIRHFDRSGVAKVLEYASRMVADQERLSTRFAQVKELAMEADYWAGQSGASLVSGDHVKQAIDEKVFRHNLVDERIRELIHRGTIMIDTRGAVVGQVNGLSVYMLGDITFGRPSRITAKTFMGRGGVINIERESQLSGPIHNKGVMILGGYLGWKYAQDKPLSLSASLCFEQSYEGVEGDSASSTELYAILSSLSGVPIKQNIAVTGSVNQKGEVQPIGGVNHKIEGFFRVCKAEGLTGDQGVLIPQQNIKNLVLQDEVVEAARQGQFHIYAVRTIDEGMEVLTGQKAGERKEDGTYPEGTINYLVDKRLKEIAKGLKEFYAEGGEEKKATSGSSG